MYQLVSTEHNIKFSTFCNSLECTPGSCFVFFSPWELNNIYPIQYRAWCSDCTVPDLAVKLYANKDVNIRGVHTWWEPPVNQLSSFFSGLIFFHQHQFSIKTVPSYLTSQIHVAVNWISNSQAPRGYNADREEGDKQAFHLDQVEGG